MTLYRLLRGMAWIWSRLLWRVTVEGRERIPREGPFLLIANHESILDPILIQTSCPRDVHTLTKSTQFTGTFFGWIMPRLLTIPTRRYRIDPQAVRVLLRRLEAGKGAGIYPEGERSWDGRLQPLRRGSVRVILKAGVPVIPCGISGSYDAWPRWSRRLRRGPIRIRFGRPLHFGRHDDRAERARLLPATTERISEALLALSGGKEGAGEEVR